MSTNAEVNSLESKDVTPVVSKPEKIKPKDLFTKYGVAYLATSITLSIISYSLCYYCVSHGIDVGALLIKFGIKASTMSESAGTATIAYAFHKAASPIRFPPTVALTPFVARLIGRNKKSGDQDEVTTKAAKK